MTTLLIATVGITIAALVVMVAAVLVVLLFGDRMSIINYASTVIWKALHVVVISVAVSFGLWVAPMIVGALSP
jgi:hypothetical protein